MRSKSQISIASTGQATVQSSYYTDFEQSVAYAIDTMQDEGVGVRNGVFFTHHYYGKNTSVSHESIHPITGTKFNLEHFTPNYLRNPNCTDLDVVFSAPSNSALAPQLAQAINVSAPVVDLPVAIAELRELPELLHDSGRSLIKRLSGANLKVEFGLKPLISDIRSLIDFSSHFDERARVLNKLRQGSMLRKAFLWSGSDVAHPNQVEFMQYGNGLDMRYVNDVTTTMIQKWGYAQIVPRASYNVDLANGADVRARARKIVLGLTLDASTAWELIPWSWLVDWFSNAGDILAASRNLVEVDYLDPRICTSIKTEKHYVLDSSNIYGLDKGAHQCSVMHVSKARGLCSFDFTLSASLPFLSGRQVGILASLAALRR